MHWTDKNTLYRI